MCHKTGGEHIMNDNRGILIVSSGTVHEHSRRTAIFAFEDAVRKTYPDIPVYTAWTSRTLITKLLNTTGEKVYSIDEALLKMKQDSLSHIYIQTTLMTSGTGYEQLKACATRRADSFTSISFARPLLSSTADRRALIHIIANEFSEILASDESALLLIGHGTPHRPNTDYTALDYLFKEAGHANVYVRTITPCFSAEQMILLLKRTSVKNIHLAPLMIASGSHAKNDIFGSGESSWAAQLKQAGYSVICHSKGLGEYPAIHQLFLNRLAELSDSVH